MAERAPLTLARLRAIGARRRDDPEVKALLWELKRLHEVVVQCHTTISVLHRYDTDPGREQRTLQVLKRLGKEPAVIASFGPVPCRDPSLPDYRPLERGKPERGSVNGYAKERLAQVERDRDETEREAKRASRERR